MILVVGATGLLGNRVVRKLLARGAPVRAMVRREADRQALETAGAETIFGDLKDRRSLDAACRGVATVITTANASQRGGADTIESVDLHGNAALIDAAAAAGVEHFIFVSTVGAETTSPIPIFAAKAEAEKKLRESGMKWTIVAPAAFMDVWFPLIIGSALQSGRPVPLVAGGIAPHSFIAAEDVAEYIVAAAGNPAAAGKQLFIGGPVPLSWTEAVNTASAIVGRPLPIENVVPGQPIPTLPAPLNQFIGFLMARLEQSDQPFDSSETARSFGVRQTPAETILRQMLSH